MPPKSNGPSKKTVDKQKAKTIEDKTFGMKNKSKSKKVEKYIKGVSAQVKGKSTKSEQELFMEKQKKEEERQRLKLEADLFKPAVQQSKVPVGVDPKSVVCEFFKKGMCTKGEKCKFSHNLEQGRKAEKIDLYTDRRDINDIELQNDTMDKWDQSKLEQVVESKSDANAANKTKIVCKFFLEAIESKKYGWFWECPNGGDKCAYQHCLPPGFQLKKAAKEEISEEDQVTLEDRLEEERSKLTTRTPLTLELFLKWKQDKKKEKEEKLASDKVQRETDIRSGKAMRSGREMFIFNPDLFVDDDGAVDVTELEPEKEDEGPVIELEIGETSIKTRITNAETSEQHQDSGGEGSSQEEPEEKEETEDQTENGKSEIQENLFTEEDIPESDEEK